MDRAPDEIDVLLGHPLQAEAKRLIAELVADLRSLSSPRDYYEFQKELAGHVYDAQQRQAEASRNEKRQRAGKPVGPPDAATWQLTVVLWDRIVRQLRAVGDALAWRLFNFDRRYILALSRNQVPSPIVGKDGLNAELGAVMEFWKTDRAFALLHDLTNCIRIADLTVFSEERPTLIEVKKGGAGGSRHRDQVKRAQAAVAVLNEGAPLQGREETIALVVSDQQFKTDLHRLAKVLDAAATDSLASHTIGHQQVVTALSLTAQPKIGVGAVAQKSEELKAKAFKKGGLNDVEHHLRGVRADSIGLSPSLAPFTVFPFSPKMVAALTTDLTSFEYIVGWDRLGRAFDAQGFDVELLLDPASGRVPENVAVLHDRSEDRRITIHSGGLDQLLHELVDIDRYVAAVTTAARREHPPGTSSAVLAFRNEKATWR